jgi:hypothetical protein
MDQPVPGENRFTRVPAPKLPTFESVDPAGIPTPEEMANFPTMTPAAQMHAWSRQPAQLPEQFPKLLPTKLELMDIDCDCVAHIRQSLCEQTLLSAATCHNRVLKTAWRRRQEPDVTQCARIFVKLEQCLDKHNIPFENPDLKKD